MEQLRKKLLTRRAFFVASLAFGLCALAALIAFCLPRAIEPTIPEAPPTRAPTLTATPTIHPTVTLTKEATWTTTLSIASPTNTPTATDITPSTPTASITFTPPPTQAISESVTPIPTLHAGRSGTLPTTGAAQDSGAFWTILGVVLLALGFWIYDAASKDNPTW